MQQRPLLRGSELRTELRRRHQRVLEHALRRGGRGLAGYELIYRRAHGVDVRPRPLLSVGAVLLLRSVAVLEHDSQALLAAGVLQARRAEVEHLDAPVAEHHDIRRAYVAMDKPFLMHLIQREHRRFQQCKRFVHLKYAVLLGVVGKILAFEVLHDDIRRTVFLEIVPQSDDISVLDELRESFGFGQETAFAEVKGIVLHGVRREHSQGHTAVGSAAGVILLYRDLAVKPEVIADVCNAEAARAEHLADKVPAVEDAVHRQLMRRVFYIQFAAAEWALPVCRRELCHAAWAEEQLFHGFSSE